MFIQLYDTHICNNGLKSDYGSIDRMPVFTISLSIGAVLAISLSQIISGVAWLYFNTKVKPKIHL